MQDINIIMGRDTQKTSLTQTWFFYVSPTGAEQPLSYAPQKLFSSRADRLTGLTHMVYRSDEYFRIKMFTARTAHGKMRESYTVYIDVNPKAELITLEGINGWGRFNGRATLEKVPDALPYTVMASSLMGDKKPTKRSLVL